MVLVWKTKSPLFCLRYDPLIVFRRQNHITFIFIKPCHMPLIANGLLFWPKLKGTARWQWERAPVTIHNNWSRIAFSSPLKAALKTCLYCMTSSNVTGTVIFLVGMTPLSHSSAVGKYNWPAILCCKEREKRVCFVTKHPRCLGFFF